MRDIAKAFDLILHKGKTDELYNIAGRSEVTVHEVARVIWRLMGMEGDVEEHIQYVKDREFNDYRYAIDGKKLENLGWTAETDFEDGMKETGKREGGRMRFLVAWYLAHPDHWSHYEAALEAHPRITNAMANPMIL